MMQTSNLPLWRESRQHEDWLVKPIREHSAVYRTENPDEVVISNGLIARKFHLGSTVAIDDLRTGENLLRGPKCEAEVTLDGRQQVLGGLTGQPDLAYLTPSWLSKLVPIDSPFKFERMEIGEPGERLPWKRTRHSPDAAWPPKGIKVTFWYSGPAHIAISYELYDGIPAMSKWIAIQNIGDRPLTVDTFTSEVLRFVEPDSVVDSNPEWRLPAVTIATDYSFGGMAVSNSNRTAYWQPDPDYKTQVNYELKTPCLLEMRPPLGPDAILQPGQSLSSFRTFELFHDSDDRERRGLGVRRLFRTLAPWTSENPLMLHLTSTDPTVVHKAIDQAAECGFELVIISFWSGLDMEDVSPANIAKFREFREYANSKGLQLGGYSLLASRHIDDKNDVINPKTGKTGGAIFGDSPCLCSAWGAEYFRKIKTFIEQTGFQCLEHDGSYPGDVCASTTHPGHRGLADSQWNQYQVISELYRWAREKGMYLNVPDNYFLAGSNKTGMGYRESNWSLPRVQQHIHARQNLFDGTWEKTPSMGWMMVPLVEYQGGGPEATIEPLHEHLPDYEQHLANNLGYGAQACYRGPRLYDTAETKAAVVKWVTWFKKHREILESDVIHVRRADGVNLDCALHVNPNLPTKATAVVYNPTDHVLEQEIELPLYYSGLTDSAKVAQEDGKPVTMHLDRSYRIRLHAKVGPRSRTWFTVS
jgi:hypothetical protein